nr:hypothetical protein [Gordonia soli]
MTSTVDIPRGDRAVTEAPADGAASHSLDAARSAPPPRWLRWSVLAGIVAIAIGVRLLFLDQQTMDYQAFLSRWYQTLDTQGFGAFRQRFADYNYPYLYLLWVLTVLNVPALIGVKALSITFDFLLGWFAYRIVGLRTDRFWLRAAGFGTIVLLPSVVANSSYWGQADAIYSAFAVGGIYFLLRAQRDHLVRYSVWACVFFGVAVAFKLQAVFVMPVLVWLLLRRRLPWYSLLAIPVVFLALDVPAVLAGASWSTALSVYLDQTGSYQQLTLGAANLYQLIPIEGDATWLAHIGIGAAFAVVALFFGWTLWRRPPVTPTTILVVATAGAVVIPFLLPAMHDRYFYAAEVLTVVTAFYLPLRFVLIPILVQAAAIGVYHSSLTGDQGQAMGGGPGAGGPRGGGATDAGLANAGARPSGPSGHGPGEAAGSRPGGGDGGGGRQPTVTGAGRGGSGYTSGRGDTALSIYASMMGLAVLGIVYAVGDSFRRARAVFSR